MTDHKYGPNGHIVDAFIDRLNDMTLDDWNKFHTAWYAARYAAGDAAWYAAGRAAGGAARDEAGDAAIAAAAGRAAGRAAGYAAWYAAWEIQGADLMRERGQPFSFLPMFGFADEQAVIAALQPKEGEG